MAPAAGWSYWERDIHMRFDHWVSHDGMNWTHAGKIYESSGNFDGTDRRGSTWAPMLTYDEESELWHLFYVAYRGSPAYRTPLGHNPSGLRPDCHGQHALVKFCVCFCWSVLGDPTHNFCF